MDMSIAPVSKICVKKNDALYDLAAYIKFNNEVYPVRKVYIIKPFIVSKIEIWYENKPALRYESIPYDKNWRSFSRKYTVKLLDQCNTELPSNKYSASWEIKGNGGASVKSDTGVVTINDHNATRNDVALTVTAVYNGKTMRDTIQLRFEPNDNALNYSYIIDGEDDGLVQPADTPYERRITNISYGEYKIDILSAFDRYWIYGLAYQQYYSYTDSNGANRVTDSLNNVITMKVFWTRHASLRGDPKTPPVNVLDSFMIDGVNHSGTISYRREPGWDADPRQIYTLVTRTYSFPYKIESVNTVIIEYPPKEVVHWKHIGDVDSNGKTEIITPSNISEITGPLPRFFDCSVAGMYQDCNKLKYIPAWLFDNNPSLNNFVDTFNGCTGLSGEAPPLWEMYPTADGAGCFKGCTGLSNYNSIPDSWK